MYSITDLLTTIQYLPKRFPLLPIRTDDLVLTVDSMIPKSLSGKGLSRVMPRTYWNQIRHSVYTEFNYECAVCRTTPEKRKLHCHEEWEYDDQTHTQRLTGFVAVCDSCHRVKHGIWLRDLWNGTSVRNPDLAASLRFSVRLRKFARGRYQQVLNDPECGIIPKSLDEKQRRKEIESLRRQSIATMPQEHFLKVNNCNFRTAVNHFREVAEEWGMRSRIEWKVDYGQYTPYILKLN